MKQILNVRAYMEPDMAFVELTKNQQKKDKVSIRSFLLFKLFFWLNIADIWFIPIFASVLTTTCY